MVNDWGGQDRREEHHYYSCSTYWKKIKLIQQGLRGVVRNWMLVLSKFMYWTPNAQVMISGGRASGEANRSQRWNTPYPLPPCENTAQDQYLQSRRWALTRQTLNLPGSWSSDSSVYKATSNVLYKLLSLHHFFLKHWWWIESENL